jgi:hypothetical protein
VNRINGRGTPARTLGAALTAVALLTALGLATPALAAARHPDGWSAQTRVPQAASALSPAEVASGKSWYVAYTTSTSGIDYVIHDGTWWPKVRSVSAKGVTPVTKLPPAITVYDGKLYVFWVNGSDQIRYTDLAGKTWAVAKTVSGSWGTALTTAAPALTVTSGSPGELWVVFKGHSTDNVYYTSTTGSSWNQQQVAVKDATSDGPTVAPTGISAAPLAIAWTESSGAIGYGILGFLGFESIGTVPKAGTNAAPSLDLMTATPGGTMYLAWKGTHTDKVFFSDVTDFAASSFSPSDWSPQASLPTAVTGSGPALTDSGTTLYAVYNSGSEDNIYYESATAPTS